MGLLHLYRVDNYCDKSIFENSQILPSLISSSGGTYRVLCTIGSLEESKVAMICDRSKCAVILHNFLYDDDTVLCFT